MNDIIAFIRARIAEERADAEAATPGPWRYDPTKQWHRPGTAEFEEAVFAGPPGFAATMVAGTGEVDDGPSMADAAHIARQNPAVTIVRLDALTALVDLHKPGEIEYRTADGDERLSVDCGECDNGGVPNYWPCMTLRHVAASWHDHVDYQPGWAP